MKRYLLLCASFLFLTGCNGGANNTNPTTVPPVVSTGSVSGQLFVGPTATQAILAARARPQGVGRIPVNHTVASSNFVLGEAIVQFKVGTNLATETTRMLSLFAADGLVERSSIPIVHAVTFSSNITNAYQKGILSAAEASKQTLNLIQRLQANPHALSVSPNHLSRQQAVPNDPKYKQQWNYPLIALEQAWDITTGSPNVIVAVLDTGIFPHPDLQANVIAGYDFVSDPVRAGDGDGIDPDPTAIATLQDSGMHGTHVAGTIAAVSNNRIGVTGVAWQSRIMPIRVLGKGGGSDADIINGIAYAAGLANSSGTLPAQAAKVINMSLAGIVSNPLYQQAIDAAVAAGVTIIAAAGNEALAGNPINYPCAYNNVICVGAIAPDLKRATYSEFNQFVDIAAPGGEISSGDQAGILSTSWKNGVKQYESIQGTSMAAPHIAGVAALMLTVNQTLTPLQVNQMLTSTARDLGLTGKDNEFGFGLVNAYYAVALAKNILPTTPSLYASKKVYLDRATKTVSTSLLNLGGGSISTISATSNAPWLTVSLNQTTAPATLNLTANTLGKAQAILTTSIAVSSSAGIKNIQVFFDNRPPVDPGLVTVHLSDLSGTTIATTTTSKANGFAYQFNNIAAGSYSIDAGVDRDGSGQIDNWGEYIGVYPLLGSPKSITVVAGLTTLAKNFQLNKLDDFTQYDGNGGAPIRGAILARVQDPEGNPIAGAKIYIGSGAAGTGQTDALGRTTLLGGFNGPQTVTATAVGYSTLTYWKTNASYLSFSLEKLTTANVVLNVTLTGLIVGETGSLFADSGRVDFTATAAQMTFNVPQANNIPLALSAITYDALGNNHLFASTTLPAGITATHSITLPMTPPTAWVNFSGDLVYPTGNFSLAGLNQFAFGFTYLGLDQPLFINGFQQILNPAAISVNMALTSANLDPYASAIAAIASNGLGESSMAVQLGSLLPTASTVLPSLASAILIDVPSLISPASATTTASITPTLSWTNTFSPMMQIVTILDPVTQQTLWEIDTDHTVTSITLPSIPTGGLQALSNYQWKIDNMMFQKFDFNAFDANLAIQSTTDFSTSQTFNFFTP